MYCTSPGLVLLYSSLLLPAGSHVANRNRNRGVGTMEAEPAYGSVDEPSTPAHHGLERAPTEDASSKQYLRFKRRAAIVLGGGLAAAVGMLALVGSAGSDGPGTLGAPHRRRRPP